MLSGRQLCLRTAFNNFTKSSRVILWDAYQLCVSTCGTCYHVPTVYGSLKVTLFRYLLTSRAILRARDQRPVRVSAFTPRYLTVHDEHRIWPGAYSLSCIVYT